MASFDRTTNIAAGAIPTGRDVCSGNAGLSRALALRLKVHWERI